MYRTRSATKEEKATMQKSIPSPLGHIVTGFDAAFEPRIETMFETSARAIPEVIFIWRRMPSGRFEFRRIVER